MASAAMYYGLEPKMEQNSTAVESVEINKIDNNALNTNKVASLDMVE
tara:strand:+ start:397 stop:537 length:141 start_codon:yes stop_codon:yes gene_type:complete